MEILSLVELYIPRVAGAIFTLVMGWWLIGRVKKWVERYSKRKALDPGLKGYLVSVVHIGLKVMLLLAVAQMFGVNTTSFVAIMSAMAFAVGLALQGNLSHFAAGILILMMKPFKVGDRITTQGYTGEVGEIQMFHIVLWDDEGRKVILPNGGIMGSAIVNISEGRNKMT